MFTLLRGGRVFDPEDRGGLDVLLCGQTIAAIEPSIDPRGLPGVVHVQDVGGHSVVPGFVDGHIHLVGGGGGEGFGTRVPEIWLSDLTRAGITTAVGAPGLDTASKTMDTLLARAYALDADGVSAYVYVGGFVKPWATVTGSVIHDCYAIPGVLGVKVALGEHRASRYGDDELVDLAAGLAWASGMTGKACVFHAHLGLQKAPATQLAAVVRASQLPPERFVATHVNYGPHTLAAAPELARLGVWIDVTSVLGPWSTATESVKASVAVRRFVDAGVPLSRISISSDANASVPRLDPSGIRAPYWTKVETLPWAVADLVREEGFGLSDALPLVTANPARALGLEQTKGSLAPGKDADVVVMDDTFRIRHVFARGRAMIRDGETVVRGMFETRDSPEKP